MLTPHQRIRKFLGIARSTTTQPKGSFAQFRYLVPELAVLRRLVGIWCIFWVELLVELLFPSLIRLFLKYCDRVLDRGSTTALRLGLNNV